MDDLVYDDQNNSEDISHEYRDVMNVLFQSYKIYIKI